MKVLLTSATALEIRELMERFGLPVDAPAGSLFRLNEGSLQLSVLITGVGSVMMVYHLSEAVRNEQPDVVIAAGFAGSFKDNLMPGELVIVSAEMFGDLGVLKDNRFLTVWESKLNDQDLFPFEEGVIHCEIPVPFSDLLPFRKVRDITVNAIHSGLGEKSEAVRLYNPETESMEGAAFAFFCKNRHLEFIQLRAISNFTSEPDSRKWDIPKAVKKLNDELNIILDQVKQQ